VKQSLERTLSVPCLTCQATGMVKSPATVANEIYIELRKMRKHFENADVLVRVHPETVKVLKANNARWLTDFEDLTGKNILVKSDATLHPEQFDIQG
jgi:Ribonuclease G/E